MSAVLGRAICIFEAWAYQLYKFALTIFFSIAVCFLVGWERQSSRDVYLDSVTDVRYQREVYEKAVLFLKEQNFSKAYEYFNQCSRDFPFAGVARKSLLMSAFVQYSAGKYQQAASLGEEYITQYPESKNVDYVYYLVGMSYAQMIRDVPYDQRATKLMLQYMSRIVERYTNSPYVKGARFYVTVGRNQLAAKEVEIGRYYLKRGEYVAAIPRFQLVLANYSDAEHAEEAMARLVEAYVALALMDEAREVVSLIQERYPQGYWAR